MKWLKICSVIIALVTVVLGLSVQTRYIYPGAAYFALFAAATAIAVLVTVFLRKTTALVLILLDLIMVAFLALFAAGGYWEHYEL